MLEWVLIGWNIGLTLWLFYVKRGPEGPRGHPGSDSWVSGQEIREHIYRALDDAAFMAGLIGQINALQLHSGSKLQEGDKDE